MINYENESGQSQNQFIPDQGSMQPGQFLEVMNYMKMIYTDPILREKMRDHFTTKFQSTQTNPSFQNAKKMPINYQQLEKKRLNINPLQIQNKISFELMQHQNQSLSNYLPHQKVQLNLNEKHNSFDQRPIKTTVSYKSNEQIMVQPSKKQNYFDDIPIRPMNADKYAEQIAAASVDFNHQSDITNNNKLQGNTRLKNQKPQMENKQNKIMSNNKQQLSRVAKAQNYIKEYPQNNSRVIQINAYVKAEQRPICGMKKQFKQLIEQQCPIEQNIQITDIKKAPVNFLRKGSRQYLSSAKDRIKECSQNIVQQKKEQKKEQIKRTDRSVSQNRVLGKRTQKSVLKNKQKNQKLFVEKEQNSSIKLSTAATTNINKNFIEKQKKTPKNKKINLFSDGSDDSYQQNIKMWQLTKKQQNVQNTTKFNEIKSKNQNKQDKNKNKNEHIFDNNNIFQQTDIKIKKAVFKNQINNEIKQRIEVIPNVYLTQEQINKIILNFSQQEKKQQKALEKIRQKYTDLCALLQQERQNNLKQRQKEKEEFQILKITELNKIKSQKRVMERQLKSTISNSQIKQDKEEVQSLKRQLQKEKQQTKKKDRNNKIIFEKQKKQIQQLKHQLEYVKSQIKSTNYGNKTQSNINIKADITQQIKKDHLTEKNKIKDQNQKDQIFLSSSAASVQKNLTNKYEFVQQDGKRKPTQNKILNKKAPQKLFIEQSNALTNYLSNSSSSQKSEEEIETPLYSNSTTISNLSKMNLDIRMVDDRMINGLLKFGTNIEYKRYKNLISSPLRKVVNSSRNSADGKLTNVYSDRSKQVIFENGTKRESFEDGYTILYFKNGDVKQKLIDGTILYYFKQKEVHQITFMNGDNIYLFNNNQVQFHLHNGTYTQIRHPDGTIKYQGQKK